MIVPSKHTYIGPIMIVPSKYKIFLDISCKIACSLIISIDFTDFNFRCLSTPVGNGGWAQLNFTMSCFGQYLVTIQLRMTAAQGVSIVADLTIHHLIYVNTMAPSILKWRWRSAIQWLMTPEIESFKVLHFLSPHEFISDIWSLCIPIQMNGSSHTEVDQISCRYFKPEHHISFGFRKS